MFYLIILFNDLLNIYIDDYVFNLLLFNDTIGYAKAPQSLKSLENSKGLTFLFVFFVCAFCT